LCIKNTSCLTKAFIFITAVILFAAVSGLNINAKALNKKHVLIINSYSEGLSWTAEENEGILEKLEKTEAMLDISIEYMDWKAYPTPENLQYLHDYMKYKYKQKTIDLILTTDDAALSFALENREELFNSAPVVFCGVNKKGVEDLTAGRQNVTGIVEQVDLEGTIRAAMKINPDLREIYVVFDNSESAVSTWELAGKSAGKVSEDIRLIPLNRGNYEGILEKVGQAEAGSAILLASFYSDEEGNVLGFEDFTRLIAQSSKAPVYHLYEFGLGNGVIGGSMLGGRVQGQLAGDMALSILNGVNIAAIPIYYAGTTRLIFDYEMLKSYNINPGRIPEQSMVINRPVSVLREYSNYVASAAIIIALLILFIIVLLFYLNKISRIRQELYGRNVELSRLYEDLTASGEELRTKYDELELVQTSLFESETRYKQLYEKMLNGYVVFEPVADQDGIIRDIRFIEYNDSYLYQMNINVTITPGQTWTEIFGFINRNQSIYQRVLATGETEHFETSHPDGSAFFLVNAFKINDRQVGVVFENITNYKLAIKEVRKLNEDLEERVRARTHELQTAVSQLESFAYTVSHDLKSPLRAVNSYIKIIMEDYGKSLNKDTAEMLLSIWNISRNMVEMINKLLVFSTASRAELNLEEVNIEEKFMNCFNELKAAYPERTVELVIETGLPAVMADKVLIVQVINNILSNAFKFTKVCDHARIKVGSTLTENEYIFYVKDNGVGFDMKYSSKLYGIFQRLHTSDEFEGSGIGLVTVKRIIEKHGGRTWIKGEPGTGTTIYFTIPYISG